MIPKDQAHLKISVHSSPGTGTKNNEDRYAISAFSLDKQDQGDALFAVVADGVGEHRAGEVAAEITVKSIMQAVAKSDASQPTAIMQAAIIQAGQAILAQSETDKEKRGMGSTCLCVWIVGNRLYSASVGNSRLYLLRQRRLQQVNIVHSLEREDEEDAEEGEEERESGQKEEVRGYLGSRRRVDVDLSMVLRPGGQANAARNQGARLQANDRLLLCTDGLSDSLEDDEIADILASADIEEAAAELVRAAMKKGAKHNMTAVVLGMPPARPSLPPGRVRWRRALLVGLAIIALVAISLAGLFIFSEGMDANRNPQPTAITTLTPIATNTPQSP